MSNIGPNTSNIFNTKGINNGINKKITNKKLNISYLCFVAVFFVYLFLRLPQLGTDIANSDSVRWHWRTVNFLDALKSYDLKDTYQRYHPGVTLMISNSIVKQSIQTYDITNSPIPGALTYQNSQYFPLIHKYSKLMNLVILATLFLVQLFAISKIFNFRISLVYGFLVSIEPYLIGVDRWFHLTSLETYFAFSAFIVFLLWEKYEKTKYLVFSGLLFALAILTKVTALVLLPLFLYLLVRKRSCFDFKKVAFTITIFFVTTFLFIFVLFPALWVAPLYTISKIWNGIAGGVYEDVRTLPLSSGFSYFYYLFVLFYKSLPTTFILSLPALFYSLKNYKSRKISLYLLIYLLVLSVSSKKIDRYVISIFPPLLLLISIYLSNLNSKILYLFASFALVFAIQAKVTYFPVYSAYYSPVLGTTPSYKALTNGFYNNSGEYYAQAAQSMNNWVNDEQLLWVPYNRDSFDAYYKRDTLKEYNKKVSFAVTSLDHLAEVTTFCPKLIKTYGPSKEAIILVYACD